MNKFSIKNQVKRAKQLAVNQTSKRRIKRSNTINPIREGRIKRVKSIPVNNLIITESLDKKRSEIQKNYVPLQPFFKKHGYTYHLVERGKKTMIYEIRTGKTVVGYEVFKIKISRPKNIKGKLIPAHERFPREEDFGSGGIAWDITWYDKAFEKFKELEKS